MVYPCKLSYFNRLQVDESSHIIYQEYSFEPLMYAYRTSFHVFLYNILSNKGLLLFGKGKENKMFALMRI